MPSPVDQAKCCTPEIVNVPGLEGDPGVDGENGLNAFTLTTNDFLVPAIGDPVTVQVEDSSWMVIGQVVVVDGPAHFTVTSKPSSTSAELTFLGQVGDITAGDTVSAGATVSPSGVAGQMALTSITVLATGTAATIGTTAGGALLNFGTIKPTFTVPTAAGEKWLVLARVRYSRAAWESASRTLTTRLRRTNNTAQDIGNGTGTDSVTACVIPTAASAITDTMAIISLPPIIYTASGVDDVIELWASLSAVASVGGAIVANEANITAVKISDS